MSSKVTSKDLRYTKTEHYLRMAMISLLKEKSVNKISIVELCKRAEVNKSTFYLHYRDIFDYYDHLTQSVADDIAAVFERYSYEKLISDFKQIFIEVLNTIKRNELARIILSNTSGREVLSKIADATCRSVISASSGAIKDMHAFEIKNYFITFGTIAVIQRYADDIFCSPDLADMLALQIQKGFTQQ